MERGQDGVATTIKIDGERTGAVLLAAIHILNQATTQPAMINDLPTNNSQSPAWLLTINCRKQQTVLRRPQIKRIQIRISQS
jgi:hypothetical protein